MINNRTLFLAIALFVIPFITFAQNGNAGVDFWFGFPESFQGGSSTKIVQISSQSGSSGTLSIPNGTWSQNFNIPASGVIEMVVPTAQVEVLSSEQIENKGLHLTADNPVNVQIITTEATRTESSLVLPVDVLGEEYAIISSPGFWYAPSAILVVATTDETKVEAILTDNSVNNTSGNIINITLDAGEVYAIVGRTENTDLTGTIVKSDRPIAVFSGAGETYIVCPTADPILEQVLPRNDCNNTYLSIPIDGQGDYLVRVAAYENNTTVSIDGDTPINLNIGDFVERTLSNEGHCIVANQAVSVAQILKGGDCNGTQGGDPSMFYLNPIESGLTTAFFDVYQPGSFSNAWLVIATNTDNTGNITLNGTTVNGFNALDDCSDLSIAFIQLGDNFYSIESNGSTFAAYQYNTSLGAESYAIGLTASPPSTSASTALMFETCPGGTITYNGEMLATGTTTSFNFPIMDSECDSTVVVTVIETAVLTSSLEIEACPTQIIVYDEVELAVGSVTDFSFTTAAGCDSIVTVTVIEMNEAIRTPLELVVCLGDTVSYMDTPLQIGSSTEFPFTTVAGCDSIVVVMVLGEDCPEDIKVLIPNAFSPDGDGLNDSFRIYTDNNLSRSTMKIYNRWGQLVFESSQLAAEWDGNVNGKTGISDVYLYQVEVSLTNGQTKVFSGDVTLVR